MMKNKKIFGKGPSPFDIKKQAAKKFGKKQRKAKQQKPTEKGRASKLNEELDYATSKLKGGSEKISSILGPLLINLSGGVEGLKPGFENQYFKVDDDFDGDLNKLFQHVTFKEIPNDPRINNIIDKLEEDPHMTPQQYAAYEKQYRSQAYNTLATRLNLDNFEVLEQIMNSSPAWQIAKRSALDSDQVLERWQELYDVMNEAQQADSGIFDWAIQQIENGKHSINWLINSIDDEIKLMLAGKYSQRRKLHY